MHRLPWLRRAAGTAATHGLQYEFSATQLHREPQVCDFGLARPSFNDMPTTIFWTDYVATRWCATGAAHDAAFHERWVYARRDFQC